MLYITTRGNRDVYTAHRALCNSSSPDGGRFVPFKMPYYDKQEISALQSKSFGQTVAEILNAFFSAGLTGWDVDFCIGKNSAKIVPMSHRVCVAEMWHNPKGDYAHIVNSLNNKICNDDISTPSAWVNTAARIAVLFGLYGQLLKQELLTEGQTFDVSVNTGDFFDPMAVWYAREMGLPVGTIICTCIDNSAVWDLIHRGIFINNNIDSELLMGLEQLLCATLGHNAVAEFNSAVDKRSNYTVNEALLPLLNNGLFCSVVGTGRADATINSVYRSNGYIIDPPAALCYGGMQDYRAKTGSTSVSLLLSDRTPLDFAGQIYQATGLQEHEQREVLKDF